MPRNCGENASGISASFTRSPARTGVDRNAPARLHRSACAAVSLKSTPGKSFTGYTGSPSRRATFGRATTSARPIRSTWSYGVAPGFSSCRCGGSSFRPGGKSRSAIVARPRRRGDRMRRGMSQMGQSRRIGDELGMTALPSAADVAGTGSQARPSTDYFVRTL